MEAYIIMLGIFPNSAPKANLRVNQWWTCDDQCTQKDTEWDQIEEFWKRRLSGNWIFH